MQNKYKTILVAVDGSEESDQAFYKAMEISRTNQAELIVTHVIDTTSYSMFHYPFTHIKELEDFGKNLLEDYQTTAKENGMDNIRVHLDDGSPKIKIPKTIAPKLDADLIICGARGHNAVERLLIGSVSENITRYAKVDVLVVRP
ncbi:universal stress protein [Virgibacillus sp. MSP4-1]|uniref:universal stress protein n=1 Tax=Virgibacillus sp. MSP4-1 TaxID=2700081 RepID=UPI00039E87CD|nr:universal stress protein [Virgibacillus sp. MSP4-1]QHS23018.1 universal stress protein [Virgibacillus sp. MSP4-1]